MSNPKPMTILVMAMQIKLYTIIFDDDILSAINPAVTAAIGRIHKAKVPTLADSVSLYCNTSFAYKEKSSVIL